MAEYIANHILTVTITPEPPVAVANPVPADGEPTALPSVIDLEIIRPFKPFTVSATLQVRLSSAQAAASLGLAGTDCVLKLYDRRAIVNPRDAFDDGKPYCPEREAEYQAWLADETRVEIDYDAWDILEDQYLADHSAIFEHSLVRACTESTARELQIYRRLTECASTHGKALPCPRLYGTVTYESPIGPITGLLLEYIAPSMTLGAYIERAAPCGHNAKTVAEICDQAMSALEACHDADILNEDVRLRNTLVELTEDAAGRGFADVVDVNERTERSHPGSAIRCVLIDFGEARVRAADETDLEWKRAKMSRPEDADLSMGISSAIRSAMENECPEHGLTCRASLVPPAKKPATRPDLGDYGQYLVTPIWSYTIPLRYLYELEPELIDLSMRFVEWGFYTARPYPQTMEECEQMLARRDEEDERRRWLRELPLVLTRFPGQTPPSTPS